LLILSLWVLPVYSARKQILDVSVGDSTDYLLESVNLSLDAPQPEVTVVDVPIEVAAEFEVPQMEFVLPDAKAETSMASFVPTKLADGALATTSSVESAVDRITAELNSKLAKDDLLVVWLLDSSNSLVDDRKRVAARLTPFYEGIVAGSGRHELRSAVVSFGDKMRERVSPTEFGQKIISAVDDLPVDRTGNEKIFDAVAKCAAHYRSEWDKQLTFVIWTDESGDDVRYLEDTIETCRQQSVSVSVVGPSSVLGADTGLHSYTDPKSGSVYQLPVRRGPDTAMPERLELGYWYRTGWGRGRRGGMPSWVGGQDLEGILTSFSPYALTRLAMQTGGSYTIFDRREDRGPFDLNEMMKYAPSYASIDDYRQETNSHPLRVAVMRAVNVLDGKRVDAPDLMLFTKKTGPRVFDFMRYYYAPAEFRAKLSSSKRRLTGQVNRYSRLIETALKHVSENENPLDSLEDLYRYETSPRWKAWYDLTRGRLLATSVRLEEYRLTLDHITKPGVLAGSTNYVSFVDSSEFRSGSEYQARLQESIDLLRRCVRENAGTPWETLAQRELDFDVGVGYRERALTLENGPATRTPNLPRF
ncbi:MAG: VWA domain-containing protein, partial [Rubripirellula sp.]